MPSLPQEFWAVGGLSDGLWKKALGDLAPPWAAPGDEVRVKPGELHPNLRETDQQLFHLAATRRTRTALDLTLKVE